MPEPSTLPLVILGGRDRRPAALPEGSRDRHVLEGYKAVDLEIGGRPLIEILVERMRESGSFDPIYIAGPALVYQRLDTGARLIDTDGSFGDNLRALVATITAEHPGRQIMVTTCDILPDPEELRRALADYHSHRPLDFWMPQIPVARPERLGQSEWKPQYRFRPEVGVEPITVLPGHLVAVDPGIVRLEIVYRFLDALYRSRNRPIGIQRVLPVASSVLAQLFTEDFRRLVRGRRPNVTTTIAYNTLREARRLSRGIATRRELEDRIRRMMFREDHLRSHPQRRGRIAILDVLSLAKDIDTEEEAREVARGRGMAVADPASP